MQANIINNNWFDIANINNDETIRLAELEMDGALQDRYSSSGSSEPIEYMDVVHTDTEDDIIKISDDSSIASQLSDTDLLASGPSTSNQTKKKANRNNSTHIANRLHRVKIWIRMIHAYQANNTNIAKRVSLKLKIRKVAVELEQTNYKVSKCTKKLHDRAVELQILSILTTEEHDYLQQEQEAKIDLEDPDALKLNDLRRQYSNLLAKKSRLIKKIKQTNDVNKVTTLKLSLGALQQEIDKTKQAILISADSSNNNKRIQKQYNEVRVYKTLKVRHFKYLKQYYQEFQKPDCDVNIIKQIWKTVLKLEEIFINMVNNRIQVVINDDDIALFNNIKARSPDIKYERAIDSILTSITKIKK